jgi:hypothetical protein
MKDRIQLNDVNPQPAADSDASSILRLPSNKRINDFEIIATVAGALVGDGFGDIKFLFGPMNEEKQQRIKSFAELDDYNGLIDPETRGMQNKAIPGADTYSIFELAQYWRKQYVAAEKLALDILPGMSGKIEVGVLDTAAAKSLAFRGLVEDLGLIPPSGRNLVNGLPVLEKWYRSGRNMNVDSLEVLDITPLKDVVTLLDLYNPTEDAPIDYVQVTKDGKLIFNRTAAENKVDLIRHGLHPDDRRFTIVPGVTDNPVDDWNLNGAEELKVLIHTAAVPAAGSSVKIITHKVGLPD